MRYLVDGKPYDLVAQPAKITQLPDRLQVEGYGTGLVRRHNGKIYVSLAGVSYVLEPAIGGANTDVSQGGELKTPLPSTVVDVLVKHGDQVKKGEKLIVLEAMKMQTALIAPFDGTVTSLNVRKGEQITEGFTAAVVEPLTKE